MHGGGGVVPNHLSPGRLGHTIGDLPGGVLAESLHLPRYLNAATGRDTRGVGFNAWPGDAFTPAADALV